MLRLAAWDAVDADPSPAWRGTARFYIRRDPGQEHGVLYVADDAGERVLIDPVAIDPSGRTTLDGWQPDKEGRLLAYQLSSGGNEESLLRVMDVASGDLVDGPIDRCRYSGVAWLPGGKAFYYVRRLPPEQVPSLVDAAGRFWPLTRFLARWLGGRLDPREVAAEFRAQLRRFTELVGQPPALVNAHQHIILFPPLGPILLDVLARQRCFPYIRRVREPWR